MKKIIFLMIFSLLFCAGCAGAEYDGRAEIERARELHTGRAGASVTMTDDRTGEVVQKLDYLFVGEVMTYMYMGAAEGTRYYEFNNGTELNTVTLPDETQWSFIAKGSEGYYSYSKASRHYYADGARLFAVYEAAIDGTERMENTIRFSYDEAKLSEYAAFAEMGEISDFSMSYTFDEAGYCTEFTNAYTMDGTAYSYTVTIEGRDEPVTRTEVFGERAEETESAADMTAKAEKTEDSDTVQEEKSPRPIKIFDFGFESVEEYDALGLDLSAVLKGDERCVGYAKIDNFTVLDIGNGFMWGPDNPLVILSENGTWRIDSLPYRGNLHFFIDENRLCIYDSYLHNGFDHFSYYEYDLTEEARTGLYIEVRGLGNEEPYYECDGFDFHSAYEAAEHIAAKTGVLYRLQRYIYENHEIKCGKYYLEGDDSQYIEITEGYGFQMHYDFYQDLYERDREYLDFLEENGETEEIGEALSRIRERADRRSAFSYYQLSPNRGDLQPKETPEYIANGSGWTMEMPDENTIRYAEDVIFVYREGSDKIRLVKLE